MPSYYSPEHRTVITRPDLNSMNDREIQAELVADAVSGVFTPLDRFVEGCVRISILRGIPVDDAYGEIRAEALSLGAPGMLLGEMK